jgi:hypothetical protein
MSLAIRFNNRVLNYQTCHTVEDVEKNSMKMPVTAQTVGPRQEEHIGKRLQSQLMT